jgi:hypothetical protein
LGFTPGGAAIAGKLRRISRSGSGILMLRQLNNIFFKKHKKDEDSKSQH